MESFDIWWLDDDTFMSAILIGDYQKAARWAFLNGQQAQLEREAERLEKFSKDILSAPLDNLEKL